MYVQHDSDEVAVVEQGRQVLYKTYLLTSCTAGRRGRGCQITFTAHCSPNQHTQSETKIRNEKTFMWRSQSGIWPGRSSLWDWSLHQVKMKLCVYRCTIISRCILHNGHINLVEWSVYLTVHASYIEIVESTAYVSVHEKTKTVDTCEKQVTSKQYSSLRLLPHCKQMILKVKGINSDKHLSKNNVAMISCILFI
jgi:hypothetical protein